MHITYLNREVTVNQMPENYYSFWNYFNNLEVQKALLADTKRLKAYEAAIKKVVKKGDIVVDLGAGLGIFSFMAVQAGASKVYAIEAMNIIEKAKLVAAENNFSDKIEFIQDSSLNVTLPQKADVIISEILGEFGLDENILHFTKDAYRFLKPRPTLIPFKLELFMVPFESQEFYSQYVDFWNEKISGLSFTELKKGYHMFPVQADFQYVHRFLCDPVRIASFDMNKITDTGIEKHLEFELNSNSVVHGLLGFFRAHLAQDVIVENIPLAQMSCWRNLCFPIAKDGNSLNLKKYDKFKVKLKGTPTKDIFDWNLQLL